MNVALYGLAIHGVGCVIPTPLDQATQETNARPVFVNEKVLPMFGPIGPFSQTQVVTLSMVASDANLGDATVHRQGDPSPAEPGGRRPPLAPRGRADPAAEGRDVLAPEEEERGQPGDREGQQDHQRQDHVTTVDRTGAAPG